MLSIDKMMTTMEKTEIKVGTDYMDFIHKFYSTIKEQNIILVYEGEITQEITKAFTNLTEANAEKSNNSSVTTKRLYHVMVECLQNVCKHADDEYTGQPRTPGTGIFIVSNSENYYTVTTGNVIASEKVEDIRSMIDKLNALDPEEVKELYKKMIKESRLSEKGGAGLGFIDIIKKTGNKIEYQFTKMNDKAYFFIQRTQITRE